MYCHTFVSPGIGATVQTFFFLKVLMMEDFPVFGYPMKPTEICLRLECSEENCRRSAIREPFPNEFVILAWKASVGYSLDRARTQEAYNNH